MKHTKGFGETSLEVKFRRILIRSKERSKKKRIRGINSKERELTLKENITLSQAFLRIGEEKETVRSSYAPL